MTVMNSDEIFVQSVLRQAGINLPDKVIDAVIKALNMDKKFVITRNEVLECVKFLTDREIFL